MQTVTTLELRDAFIAAILAITPTMEPLRDVRWSYVPSPRKGGVAVLPAATRNFDLVFSAGVPFYGVGSWVGSVGASYKFRLAVATSYAGCDPDLREHLATADGVDLKRALERLRDPSVPGLVNIEAQGLQNERADSEANATTEHVFIVSYHQATA